MDISGNNSIFTMLHDISLESVGNSGLAGKFLTILYRGAHQLFFKYHVSNAFLYLFVLLPLVSVQCDS